MPTVITVVLIIAFIQGTQPIRWTDDLPDGHLMYACAGDQLTLAWDYTLSPGESLEDVQWFYDSPRANEMIAVLAHDNFLPLPAFSHRVQFVRKAGITLINVSVDDSGNYTMEMSGHEGSGAFFRYRRTVVLQVGDNLMTTDGYLHVTENQQAVQNPNTHEWSIELHCGTFTYQGQPPFDVEWITPSGGVLSSTSYEDGHFTLLLPSPVQGGNYSCRIPAAAADTACLRGGAAHKGEGSHVIDKVEARLTLLEAHQTALQKENDALKNENFHLRSDQTGLSDRVFEMAAKANQRVSFHAHNLRNTQPQHGAPLVVQDVVINQGNGYSSTTGKFTAPYNGTYFFIGTSGSWATGQNGQFDLTVDGTDIAFVATRDQGPLEAASVHGVTHLVQGQKVWLKVSSGIEFWSAATSFSGFLVSADP